jgi:hypothetical protein
MPSAGPASYNADLALLDVEMAAEYGVFREEYEDKKSFRKAAAEAGLSWAMVQAEKTRRNGKPSSTEARNAAWLLIAIEEEEKGLPMRTKLKKADGGTYRDRFIHEQRLLLQKGADAEVKPPAPARAPVRAPKTTAAAPEPAPEPAPAPATAPATAPVAEPATAPVAKADTAEAAWAAKYEEFFMGYVPCWRERESGRIFMKGEGVHVLDLEWDEDLGEWMSEDA